MGFQDALHTIRHGDQLSKDAYNTVKKWSDKRIPEAEDMLEVRTGGEEQINEHILTPMFCIRGILRSILTTLSLHCHYHVFFFPFPPQPTPEEKAAKEAEEGGGGGGNSSREGGQIGSQEGGGAEGRAENSA